VIVLFTDFTPLDIMALSQSDETKTPEHFDVLPHPISTSYDDESSSLGKGDILGAEHVDLVLDAKMHLVNNAIDEIGFTGYHRKLFVLNGFG
jgi:hypothetical protein